MMQKYIIHVPGISVTAPIRRSTPWALIKKKIPFKRPWALSKIKIYVFCSVCRNFMQYIGMLSKKYFDDFWSRTSFILT